MLDNPIGSSLNAQVAALQESRAKKSDLVETTDGTEEEAIEQEIADEQPQTEEPEADEVEEESGDELDDEDEGEEQESRYTVKVDGEEVEITLDEALKGYQRDKDYRNKTMELAEKRKAVEAQQNEYNATIEKLAAYMEQVETETDWESLRDNDPAEYIRQKELQDQRAKEVEQGRIKQQEQRQQIVDAESKKLKDVMGGPTWDTEQAKKDFEAATEYMKTLGVNEEEMSNLVDHRLWKMIFDAASFARMQKTKQKVIKEVKNAPKSVKSGQRRAKSQTEVEAAKEKLVTSNKRNELASAVALLKAKRGK